MSESVWIATTPKTHYKSLQKGLAVDVVVVGGGIVGLNTAYFLSKKGLSVAVIEGDRIVMGVTGHTTAKLTSLHDLIYHHLLTQFGASDAKLYWTANEKAINFYEKIIKNEKISCDFKRVSAYIFANTKKVEEIKKEYEATQKLGISANFHTTLPIPIPAKAAVEFPNQARFHPRKYLLAIAKLLTKKKNCYIFEQTRAESLVEGRICTVQTNKGEIKAKHVVMATHFPFYDKAFYFSRLTQIRSYVLGLHVKDTVPDAMFLSEEYPFYTVRKVPTPKGEIIIFGGEDHKSGQKEDTISCYAALEKAAKKYFAVKKILYRWSTQDALTPDKVPYIGLHAPGSKNIYVATGFNEWGMTHGMVAALLLTDMITRKKNPWETLYDPNRFKPLTAAPTFISENLNTAKHLVKGHIENPEKVGIYKDKYGKVYKVSRVCTHMGCILNWNNVELSWDCPCHGSRFSYKGNVLHGPAVKDLEQK